MCGIAGILFNNTLSTRHAEALRLRSMLSAMSHRGPDGEAQHATNEVAFGANRLAIRGIDRVQPPLFVHEAGIVVVCNGEIDNHQEIRRSLEAAGHLIEGTSDIAVLAPLYLEKGLAFLEELEGVFALALWDERKRRLILARDRAGERHLYYAAHRDGVVFASELASMMAGSPAPTTLDKLSLSHYLRSGYCPAQWSLLSQHFKVCPGEAIVWEGNSTRHLRYWQPPLGKVAHTIPDATDFDGCFRNAILRQTDIEAHYGVLLSGGLDSSLIAAVTRSVRPRQALNAYCVRFEDSSFDEGGEAENVARQLLCDLTSVTIGPGDIPSTLRTLVRTTGEPLADPAWLPLYAITKRASQDVKMLLSGEGADELFGGYPAYLGAHLATRYDALPTPLRSLLRGIVEAMPVSDKKVSLSFLLKKFVDGRTGDGLARHLLWTANLTPDWINNLGFIYPPDCTAHDPARLMDVIQHHDFTHSLPDALLAKADRGGMCHGLEIRAPFLDRAVIEYAATLPISSRIRGVTTKVFLKEYAQGYLPRRTILRRKRGLSVPLGQWLRGPLREWAIGKVTSPLLAEAGINSDAVIQLFNEHAGKRGDHARGLWNLIVLSEWLEWLQEANRAVADRTQADQVRASLISRHQRSFTRTKVG